MYAHKSVFRVFILASALALSACSSQLIGVRLGAENVALAEAGQVNACEPRGRTQVSVMAEVGFITRKPEDVEANLLQMARNEAVSKNADTVVKGDSQQYGKRSFALYRCQR